MAGVLDLVRGAGSVALGGVGGTMLGGVAGWSAGNEDALSFGVGATVGGLGGLAALAAAPAAAKGVESVAAKVMSTAGEKTAKHGIAQEAHGIAAATAKGLGTAHGRAAAFAGGALLAGGLFSGMFLSGRRRNRARGSNAHRGNRF